jgi:hypothetical protein
MLTWKQGIFAYRAPRRFAKISRVWLLICSSIMWVIWKEHLDAAFNGIYWHPDKILQKVWLGLVDYGHSEWDRVKARRGGPAKFVVQWCYNNVIAQMLGEKPHWHLTGPIRSFQ